MKNIKNIIIIFFLLVTNLEATEISISGNQRVSDETVKVYGEIKSQENYTNKDLDKILKNLYSTNFFKDVQISFDAGILKIIVVENPIVNSIEINGEPAKKIKEEILERMLSKTRESFIESFITKDIELIKSAYNSLGYLLVEVDIKKEVLENDDVNLIIDINRGDKIKISKINFIGDKKIRERRLRDIIVSQEDKFYKFITRNTVFSENNVELDKRLLLNYYKSQGYYDAQVLTKSALLNETKRVDITYNINAGNRYRISKIGTNIGSSIEKSYFEDLKKSYNKVIGEFYSPFKIKKVLEDLDLLILNNDLQFIEHSVNEIRKDENIELVINIFEGEKVLVERVDIKGNTITNEDVIRSELLLDEGDPYNKLKIEQSISEIKSRNIFGTVDYKVKDGEETNTKIIEIEVSEKATGEIAAGAGVGTDGGSFAFSISENNWLGKGVRLKSFLEVDANTLKGAISATDPNFNFSGNALSFFVSSTTNDFPESGYENSLISAGASTKYEQYRNIFFSPGISLTSDKLTVLDTASDSLKKQAGTFTDLTFDYGLSYDNRNRSFMPTNGYLSSFSQALPILADASALKNIYSLSAYKEVSEDLIGAFKFYAATINGIDEDVRLSKRLKVPSRRLRGFESGKIGPKDGGDFVGGNYASAVNLEANLPNLFPEATKVDVGFFLDFGNVWGVDYDSSLNETNTIRSSTGLNANWLSPLGPMSITLSQNISKASSDITQSFKFQLGTTF